MTTLKIKPVLPYIGIPIAAAVLLLLRAGRIDPFITLRHELLIVFSYIAAVLDIKVKRIPNNLVLAMLAAWVLIMTPRLFLGIDTAIALLMDSALGFAIGGGIFLLVYIVSRKGLGGGDVKFMAVAGLYSGLAGILPAMLIGTVFAALVGFLLILLKRIGRKDTMPLAPFLFIGILVTVYLL